jgi:cardiolipin synthase
MYILDDDGSGREFVAALAERARAGVNVKVLVDWLGGRRGFAALKGLEDSGAEVRIFNAPGFSRPARVAHARSTARRSRSTIRIGFVSGLCVSDLWLGDPKRLEPWRGHRHLGRGSGRRRIAARVRDRGTSRATPSTPRLLADQAKTFPSAVTSRCASSRAAERAGTYRLDLTIASVARSYLWLTDAYFVGTSA